MCCEVVRPGLGWWINPQGIPHENWEEAECSCGDPPPNCYVYFHKLVSPPDGDPVHHEWRRGGKCVACEGDGGGEEEGTAATW